VRSREEIEGQAREAIAWVAGDSTDVAGMSYEEGVDAALQWVLGQSDDKPIENDFEG
jgi:hypothetical protein